MPEDAPSDQRETTARAQIHSKDEQHWMKVFEAPGLGAFKSDRAFTRLEHAFVPCRAAGPSTHDQQSRRRAITQQKRNDGLFSFG